jgi:hypothetical protein
MDRLDRVQRFHDAQAAERARTFAAEPKRLQFTDGEYLDHQSWIRPALEWLGPLAGRSILDWVDVPTAAAELRRVLRPDGVAVLCEPWGGNPLLRFARRWLPYSRHSHTDDEEPLREVHLEVLKRVFPAVESQGFSLFSLAPITRYVVIALRPS